MASKDLERHLLNLQQQLLNAIACGDYDAYAGLCSPAITCFEPEARGHLVEGLPFHETYFKHKGAGGSTTLRNTITGARVQLLGGEESPVGAVVSYVRLVQVKDEAGKHATTATQETRVWERTKEPWSGQPWGEWHNVHLHRSPA
ncbi:MAG: calcium/calmodulin dependent protein kinase II association-domain-containing protein [Monoraphidium minutum]|nr:MAG: calcium/calmodulin dependent protein kinase II association-domain-containing protein [Monoraphidium minutum]